MRTTVNLDEDVLEAARSLARSEGRSLGSMLSRLLRRGLEPRAADARRPDGFPVFQVPPDAQPITAEMVADANRAAPVTR